MSAAAPLSAPPWRRRAWTLFKVVFAASVFGGAIWLLRHELQSTSIDLIARALRATSPIDVGAAIVFTACSYLCLAASEWWALASTRVRLPPRRILLVSFVSYALSNGLGFSLATGAAARLRFYRAWGLAAPQIAAVTVLAGVAVTLSGLVTAGLAVQFIADVSLPVRIAGLIMLTPASLWLVRLPRRIRIFTGAEFFSPPLKRRLAALLGGILDWVFSGLALLLLMPGVEGHAIAPFLATFVLGSVISAASGVPGGLGVFEAVVLTLSREFTLVHETAAALLLYRLIYGLGPLVLAAGYLAFRTLPGRRLG